jgi:predicted transcriptional regulator
MADNSSAQKVDPRQVAEIVSSYVSQNSLGVDQVAGLIATVHRTLSLENSRGRVKGLTGAT